MEKKDQCPFFCQSEIDGGKKCETVCSYCLPTDVEKAAAMFVLELFNGGVSPDTEKHCINCFIAGWRASQSSEKGEGKLKEENKRLREALKETDEYLSQVNYEKGKPVYLNSVGALSILHKQIKQALSTKQKGE